MNCAPPWLQIAAYVVQIFAAAGAAAFTLGVLWPSIRKSNRASERICKLVDLAEKKGVDDIFERL